MPLQCAKSRCLAAQSPNAVTCKYTSFLKATGKEVSKESFNVWQKHRKALKEGLPAYIALQRKLERLKYLHTSCRVECD